MTAKGTCNRKLVELDSALVWEKLNTDQRGQYERHWIKWSLYSNKLLNIEKLVGVYESTRSTSSRSLRSLCCNSLTTIESFQSLNLVGKNRGKIERGPQMTHTWYVSIQLNRETDSESEGTKERQRQKQGQSDRETERQSERIEYW